MTGMAGDYYEKRAGQLPGLAWMINYDADRAFHNYHYLAMQMADGGHTGWPRVYTSRDCAAIVVTNAELDDIHEPHVMAWRNSFFELGYSEFLSRIAECLEGRRRYLGDEAVLDAA